jgi:hypothetical protein
MKRAIAVLAVLAFAIWAPGLHAEEGLRAGVEAPAFSLPAAGTTNTVSLQSFVNKSVVILHFWKSK